MFSLTQIGLFFFILVSVTLPFIYPVKTIHINKPIFIRTTGKRSFRSQLGAFILISICIAALFSIFQINRKLGIGDSLFYSIIILACLSELAPDKLVKCFIKPCIELLLVLLGLYALIWALYGLINAMETETIGMISRTPMNSSNVSVETFTLAFWYSVIARAVGIAFILRLFREYYISKKTNL